MFFRPTISALSREPQALTILIKRSCLKFSITIRERTEMRSLRLIRRQLSKAQSQASQSADYTESLLIQQTSHLTSLPDRVVSPKLISNALCQPLEWNNAWTTTAQKSFRPEPKINGTTRLWRDFVRCSNFIKGKQNKTFLPPHERESGGGKSICLSWRKPDVVYTFLRSTGRSREREREKKAVIGWLLNRTEILCDVNGYVDA